MATPNERTLTDLVPVDNEPLNKKKLDLDGAYRWIDLTFILNITNTGSVPALIEDGFFNYFSAVGIRKNSKTYKFNLPLRLAVKVQTAENGTPSFFQAPSIVASATYDAIVKYRINFAEFIHEENDLSALLQTGDLTNLELVISTGDINDIFSSNAPTINTRTVEIEIRDFTGEHPNGGDINNPKEVKMTDIIELSEEIDLEVGKTNYTKLAQEIDMVSGSSILKHAGLITDNGLASDARVTDIRTWNVEPRTSDIERNFKSLSRSAKTNSILENLLTGYFEFNYQKKFGREGFVTGAKSKELLQLLTNGIVAT